MGFPSQTASYTFSLTISDESHKKSLEGIFLPRFNDDEAESKKINYLAGNDFSASDTKTVVSCDQSWSETLPSMSDKTNG